MVGALFDTNILIDYLGGVAPSRAEFSRYEDRSISIVTWIEVMVGAVEREREVVREFLSAFSIIALDQTVAEAAVALRRAHRIKLPDAIIWASATTQGRLLVTRNERDFPIGDPSVRMPYRL